MLVNHDECCDIFPLWEHSYLGRINNGRTAWIIDCYEVLTAEVALVKLKFFILVWLLLILSEYMFYLRIYTVGGSVCVCNSINCALIVQRHWHVVHSLVLKSIGF